ncbi:MAG: stage II sporulation protein E [Candidatus Improbicoccus devescovinae]|nr:MAG: stage II sporulation protein E [Candidatus Improbicoccus devescovinae]
MSGKVENIQNLKFLSQKIVKYVIIFALSLILSNISLFMNCYPLGLSLIALSNGYVSFFSLLGSVAGYFCVFGSGKSVRYITAAISIFAARWAFSDSKKIKKYVIIFFITLIPCFLTGMSLNLALGLNFENFSICSLESVIAAFVACILQAGYNCLFDFKVKSNKKSQLICLVCILGIIYIPFLKIKILEIPIFKCIINSLVMLCAFVGGSYLGNLAGCLHSIISCIANSNSNCMDPVVICMYPIVGLIAGSVSYLGKIAICFIYIISSLIIHLQFNQKINLLFFYEYFISSLIFLLIPNKIIIKFKKIINKNLNIPQSSMRSFMIQNFSILSQSFIQVDKLIKKIYINFMNIKQNNSKDLFSSHLNNLSYICSDLCYKIEDENLFDEQMTSKLRRNIKKIINETTEISCRYNSIKKTLVQITISKDMLRNPNIITKISDEVSFVCGKTFSKPEFLNFGNKILLRMHEKPIFTPNIFVNQHCSSGEQNCGDSCVHFLDGLGNFYAMLSDGMGTGDFAHLDGEITNQIMSRLIKSGINPVNALEIANYALKIKSNRETSATFDYISIDLFTGNAIILKAGASPTFIRKKNKIFDINSPSLPIGILNDIKSHETRINLEFGDSVLMFTDGAINSGDDWVKNMLKLYASDNSDKLVNNIISEAIKRSDCKEDDITAVSISI